MNGLSRVIKFVRPSAARLALLYLAILMIVSITLSTALYRVSVDTLQIAIPNTALQGASSEVGMPLTPKKISNPDDAKLNMQLKQTIATAKRATIEKLVTFNVAVLVGGAVLCYYLAYRILAPIEMAAEAQARFASDASHELRTPLTVMQTANEKALRTLRPSKPMQSVLQENLAEIAQLKSLAESLLRLAHESEASSLQPVSVDSAASAAMQQVAKLATANSVTIQITVPHFAAMADEQSLIQVLTILLSNAIVYSPKKGLVRLAGHGDGKHVYLSVQDEGIGIAPNDLRHIFERFYRTDQSRKQHPAGHGLGLSIARILVRQQHGDLAVTSTVNEGSTFTIKLAATT